MRKLHQSSFNHIHIHHHSSNSISRTLFSSFPQLYSRTLLSRISMSDSNTAASLFTWPFSEKELNRPDFKNGPGAAIVKGTESFTIPPLFQPLKLSEDITLKNRIIVSPMCQYTSEDGFFSDWHLVELGGYAVGGASLVFTEASAVTPEGRISPTDAGIYKDEHIDFLKRITNFIHQNKAYAGIQLAHAGRKASTAPPFFGNWKEAVKPPQGWTPVAPSPLAFSDNYILPHEITKAEIQDTVKAFGAAAIRAEKAGFDVVELHGAHGYLISSFNSALSNKRTDEYGGSFEGRTRFCLEVVREVRRVWKKPLFVRLSCSDWVEGGWDLEQTIQLAKLLKEAGVDLIDCSSGGVSSLQKIQDAPGYQVPFAEGVKKNVPGLLVGAVGRINDAQQANDIIAEGKADVVLIARAFIRDSNWPLKAAAKLNVDVSWALEYSAGKHYK